MNSKDQPKQTIEEVAQVNRTELFYSILSIVKNLIDYIDVDGDTMDAPSCAYEIEQLFYKCKFNQCSNIDEVADEYAWRVKKNTFSDKVKANELAESAKNDFIVGYNHAQTEIEQLKRDKAELVEALIYSFSKIVKPIAKTKSNSDYYDKYFEIEQLITKHK